MAALAQRCAALCAAKGVLLREPLKPTQPAEPEQTVLPSKSVIVINVLLNVAFICTIARTTLFLTFRFVFFAIIFLVSQYSILDTRDEHRVSFLTFFLYALLARDCFSRAFAGACIALGALAPNRQTPSMTKTSVTVDVTQASYVLGNLSAKLAFHDIIAVDNLGYAAKLIFTELAGLCAFVNTGLFQNLLRGVFTYTNNIGQRNPYRFVIRNINTNDTRHISSFFN
jgi:hypothetical protein